MYCTLRTYILYSTYVYVVRFIRIQAESLTVMHTRKQFRYLVGEGRRLGTEVIDHCTLHTYTHPNRVYATYVCVRYVCIRYLCIRYVCIRYIPMLTET